jgi:hypothetical protein
MDFLDGLLDFGASQTTGFNSRPISQEKIVRNRNRERQR